MTIKRKLTVIMMFTCLVGLLVVGAGFITCDFIQLRQNMMRSLSVQAEIMANNCKAALAFDDPEDARIKRVQLTAKARNLMDRIEKPYFEEIRRITRVLSGKEMDSVSDALTRVSDSL